MGTLVIEVIATAVALVLLGGSVVCQARAELPALSVWESDVRRANTLLAVSWVTYIMGLGPVVVCLRYISSGAATRLLTTGAICAWVVVGLFNLMLHSSAKYKLT